MGMGMGMGMGRKPLLFLKADAQMCLGIQSLGEQRQRVVLLQR